MDHMFRQATRWLIASRWVILLFAFCVPAGIAARAASASAPDVLAVDEPRRRPGSTPTGDLGPDLSGRPDALAAIGLDPRRFPPVPLPRVARARFGGAEAAEAAGAGRSDVVTRSLAARPARAGRASVAPFRERISDGSRPAPEPLSVAAFGSLQAIQRAARPPWQMNARLFIGWPDGLTGSCSASLIGAHHAITAGHCVFSHEDGGWADWLVVVPAYEEGRAPLGLAQGVRAMSWEPWIAAADSNHDMAVIALDDDIGSRTGWFGLSALACGEARGLPASNAGYPAEGPFDGEHLIFRSGVGNTCRSATVLHVDGPSWGGHSGSSLYLRDADQRYVTGIVSYTTFDRSVTGVVLLPDWRYDQIQAFLDE